MNGRIKMLRITITSKNPIFKGTCHTWLYLKKRTLFRIPTFLSWWFKYWRRVAIVLFPIISHHMGSIINHVVKFLGIFDPPPPLPSWSLLLNTACVMKGSFPLNCPRGLWMSPILYVYKLQPSLLYTKLQKFFWGLWYQNHEEERGRLRKKN